MLLVGLTGGIGSGKSEVARSLERRGAIVFDADRLARQVVEPGTPGHRAVVERFGSEVLDAAGRVDREALAGVVFGNEGARQELEAIVHPEVFRLLAEGLEPYRTTDRVVVFDAPLIVETGFAQACDVVVLVAAPEEERVRRLVADRGMSQEAARARIEAQSTDEEKRRHAHLVVQNAGSFEDLERGVEDLWADLLRRARPG